MAKSIFIKISPNQCKLWVYNLVSSSNKAFSTKDWLLTHSLCLNFALRHFLYSLSLWKMSSTPSLRFVSQTGTTSFENSYSFVSFFIWKIHLGFNLQESDDDLHFDLVSTISKIPLFGSFCAQTPRKGSLHKIRTKMYSPKTPIPKPNNLRLHTIYTCETSKK